MFDSVASDFVGMSAEAIMAQVRSMAQRLDVEAGLLYSEISFAARVTVQARTFMGQPALCSVYIVRDTSIVSTTALSTWVMARAYISTPNAQTHSGHGVIVYSKSHDTVEDAVNAYGVLVTQLVREGRVK